MTRWLYDFFALFCMFAGFYVAALTWAAYFGVPL